MRLTDLTSAEVINAETCESRPSTVEEMLKDIIWMSTKREMPPSQALEIIAEHAAYILDTLRLEQMQEIVIASRDGETAK